jgi:type II restriction enzyme
VGLTGSHQCGFYLPKAAWEIFAPFPPEGGNQKSWPKVLWQDGRKTESCVTWYGNKTRREYRLTRFGPDFPFLTADSVGSLLVLIPKNLEEFLAYVLDFDEDIEEIQSSLGVEVVDTWGIYETGKLPEPESEDDCINRHFRKFTEALTDFPATTVFAEETRRVILECITKFNRLSFDDKLLLYRDEEYNLFRMVERKVTEPEVTRLFADVDDFIDTAARIMNRRKARAGRSLENHVEYLLKEAGIPFSPQPRIDGKVQPDILIPSKTAYEDISFPTEKLFVVGVKTTCKDRWRQVVSEAKRIPQKHILTLQPGISAHQLKEMQNANVTLIVPKRLQKDYPSDASNILTVENFITSVRGVLA